MNFTTIKHMLANNHKTVVVLESYIEFTNFLLSFSFLGIL